MTDGIRIRTEFQNPTLMPSHASPVQACDHALIQGSIVGEAGSATMLPTRISSMVLKEVTSVTQSGIRKNTADTIKTR